MLWFLAAPQLFAPDPARGLVSSLINCVWHKCQTHRKHEETPPGLFDGKDDLVPWNLSIPKTIFRYKESCVALPSWSKGELSCPVGGNLDAGSKGPTLPVLRLHHNRPVSLHDGMKKLFSCTRRQQSKKDLLRLSLGNLDQA